MIETPLHPEARHKHAMHALSWRMDMIGRYWKLHTCKCGVVFLAEPD